MKQISVSDEDYEILMELSKELQLQENDHQAFPYFWEPCSEKTIQGTEEDDHVIYSVSNCCKEDPKDLAEEEPDLFKSFLESELEETDLSYDQYIEKNSFMSPVNKWIDFVCNDPDYTKAYESTERVSEHNPSLFKSDVKNFCENNSHHLGKDPSTYARTIWRMPKMVSLVKALYRLNPQENINEEANSYVKDGKYSI